MESETCFGKHGNGIFLFPKEKKNFFFWKEGECIMDVQHINMQQTGCIRMSERESERKKLREK